MVCNDKIAVHSWCFDNKETNCNVSATRSGDTVVVTGKKGKKPVKKTIPIDSSPWFQAIEFALFSFLQSQAKECSFWMIRPTDMNMFKMVARRKAEESISVDGRCERAVQVTVSPTGIAGRLWHATVWYRMKDYKFLKSVYPRLPGTCPTIYEAIDENGNAQQP